MIPYSVCCTGFDSVPDYGCTVGFHAIRRIKQVIFMTAQENGTEQKSGRGALMAGGVSAVLASTCCLGPLLLVMLGFSGAWIGRLRVLEPYSPYFIAVALVAMVFAYRRIYRPTQACKPGEVCAIPRVRIAYKILLWPCLLCLPRLRWRRI